MLNALIISQLEAMLQDIAEEQENIYLARRYFQGDQNVYMTARALEFLGIHESNTFRLNICRTIVTSLAAELNLLGFDTTETPGETGSKPLAEWAAGIFKKNKLDSLQDTIHEAALSDRESFVIVEWDPLEQYPRLLYHPRLVEVDSGGDGFGVFLIYENDDPNQRPSVAVKQWIETDYRLGAGIPYSTIRRTLYYPDHMERWVFDNGGWSHYEEVIRTPDGDTTREWWIPWVDGSGDPLGIPVFHFKNKGLRPEHWDAIPMQDAINKQFVDALAAGDLTAFQSFFGFGFYPTVDGRAPESDGSNLMSMGPAQFNGTTKPASEASLQVIPGADVTPIFNGLKDIILLTAQITETPASRFITTGAIASADTLKEQERQLRKKAGDRRGLFGDPWVGALNMARKLSNIYGGAALSETIPFSPIWEQGEALEDLAKKRDTIGVPIEQLWREAGYTEAQVESMKKESSYRVTFERALWEGANAASLSGIPLRVYLKRSGIPEEEIEEIIQGIEEDGAIPPTDL